jgi:hypothetical protein
MISQLENDVNPGGDLSWPVLIQVKMPVGDGGEDYTFFWKSESPFSQWYKSKFTVDDILYNCAEQFMMHQKAGWYI